VSRRTWLAALLIIATGAAVLRFVWLRADPPVSPSVGVVWHDEGAWVHNARNRALWGVWRTDAWNPVFVTPVFTALEYGAFRELGVGTWQARVVPALSGLAAVGLLMAGLVVVGDRRTALVGGALVATNFIFVMWNRAALMEAPMTAFIVAGWSAYAWAGRRPAWGLAAGAAAVLAWFTKASAAFFLAALAVDAAGTLILGRSARLRTRLGMEAPDRTEMRGAAFALAGAAVAAAVVMALFVVPHWSEYRFYNWQMSVTRKPSYGWRDLLTRASWLPVVTDFFTRMWLVLAAAAAGIATLAARWRTARPPTRLLVLWVIVGLLELVIHDSGNERRYVMFIPALIALAALFVTNRESVLPDGLAGAGLGSRLVALPVVLVLGYLVLGSLLRLGFLTQIATGSLHTVVVAAALTTVASAIVVLAGWRPLVTWLSRRRVPSAAGVVLVALGVGWNLVEYAGWARRHTTFDYQASVEVGRLLPPGTPVQGILASGLSLENRIRPLFIGNGFGNYADRFARSDVRYILTLDVPHLGYESQDRSELIPQLLSRYPGWHIVATFPVTTFDGRPSMDRAVLIDKFAAIRHARD
jgi:4-amino-4-deoxy-L-arabinose transferase-like glycosyltransferase